MVERSRLYSGDIAVFIDPDTVLFPDLVTTLNFAHKLDDDWLLFASPKDVSNLPSWMNDASSHWHGLKDGQVSRSLELQEMLDHSVPKNNCDDRILLAWNHMDSPLHKAVLPPFLYRKGVHNFWVINEAIISGFRFVFDASWTISSFSLNHVGEPHNDQFDGLTSDSDHKWERVGNSYLASVYGSLLLDDLTYSPIAKILRCNRQYIFIDGVDDKLNQKLYTGKNLWSSLKTESCISKHNSQNKNCLSNSEAPPDSLGQLRLPFSLDTLASMVADNDKTVVLAVAGYSYRDMLMSWVCRLRHLRVRNFLVCALDLETYAFAVLQGLPVFLDQSAPKSISYDQCHFGTKCFQSVTKVKSRMVLKLLKYGYNVLLSDVDVYWFANPLPYLKSFPPAVLMAQSDEHTSKGPVNLPRRLNSGFYFCRSDSLTIAALARVVKHAASSSLSEQPSFYDTLCGENGSNRVGHNLCVDRKTNLTVYFLDRNLFPNGAYRRIWQAKNVTARCRKVGCLVLHNNWIPGRSRKLERQIMSGLWDYDESRRMCFQRIPPLS